MYAPTPCGFCILLKKSLGNSNLKILDFSQLLVADTPMNFSSSKNFVYTLLQHFWDTQYKNIFLFFALIKKIFLQNLVEIIFNIIENIFKFWDPWDPPTTKKKKIENFTYGVLGIKIG